MTTDTLTPPVADADAVRREQLMDECAKLGIKADKRYSIKRMEDLIAEKKGQPSAAEPVATETMTIESGPAQSPAPQSDQMAELMALVKSQMQEVADLRKQLAEAKANPVPAQQTVADALYKVPEGTMTMAPNIEAAERAALMEQCTRLGIQNVVPAKAGNDWIRDHITRHLAAKAQEQAILDAQAAEAASRPPLRFVDMRVLPAGHLKISRGVHIPGSGDLKYSRGEIVKKIPYEIAKAQEDNGYVEILDAIAA